MISDNIKKHKENCGQEVKLVAVSKTKPEEDLIEAYNVGQRDFGENKVQDLTRKYENLPKDINWHFIGHLQTNKTKYIAPFVHLIHAVDSLKLLKAINKEALKNNRVINVLLQIYIATETTKFGLSPQEVTEILAGSEIKALKNIKIAGLMGMATNSNNQDIVRNEFRTLKTLFESVKTEFFINDESFMHLSMGMSHDYKLAIEEGSNMVRIGSSIFGARDYPNKH
ncbi:YggS family pyridoxal phosphate-dependent enzyme [Bacteroidales bacterium]|nr:YggS family pyridoxal phosphate-dependent enzyme [Bacteroidales bacterium]